MGDYQRYMSMLFRMENLHWLDEVYKMLCKFQDHIDKLRKRDVEAFRRKIEESSDIESKSRHMYQLIEENVPASLDLLESLLKESEKDPLLHLEWLSHRQNVAISLETIEKAQAIALSAHEQAKRLYLLGSPELSDKGVYKAYIKACANLLLISRYQEMCVDEALTRHGMAKGLDPMMDMICDTVHDLALADCKKSSLFHKAYLEEAQKAAEIYKDRETQHLLLILKGDILLAKGDISTAIDTVFTPLLKESHLSLKNKGLLLQKFGNACRSAGRWGLAKEYLLQSISIAQEVGDKVSEYDRMTDLGNVYKSEGRLADALKYQELHMAFAYKRGDMRALNVAGFNMSMAYNSSGLPHSDLKHVFLLHILYFVDMSILTNKELEPWNRDRLLETVPLFSSPESIPSAVDLWEDHTRAWDFCKNMYEIADSIDDPVDNRPFPKQQESQIVSKTPDTLRYLWDKVSEVKTDCPRGSETAESLVDSSDTRQIFTESFRKLWNILNEIKSRFDIGKGFRIVGKVDQAIDCHRRDFEFAQARGDDETVAIMQRELAMDYLCQKDLESAEELAKAAISTLEAIRENLGSEDASKIANFDKNQAETSNLLQVILCQRKKYAEALAMCELGRSRALTDLIRDKLLQTKEASDDWIYTSDFVSRWQDVAKEIQDDFIQTAKELRTNFLVYSVIKEYDNKENRHYYLYIWLVLNGLSVKDGKDKIHFRRIPLSEKMQSELLVDYGFFSSLTRSSAAPAEGGVFPVSKTKESAHKEPAVEENSIDIRMPQGPEVEELWQILGFPSTSATDGGVEAASTNEDPGNSDESKQMERAKLILERILEPGSWTVEGLQQLQQLYDVCVSPVEDLLPEEEEGGTVPSITILPHEFLFGVPFCCLQDGADKDKRYLVERFAISYAPSLLALRLLNERLQHLRTEQGSRPMKVLAMGHAIMSQPAFRELPSSGKEAEDVQRVFGPEDCRLALRGDATKQLMLQELRNFDILHVATHATPQDVEVQRKKKKKEPAGDYSMRGCMLLSKSDKTCSGLVKASEIASVDCNCQLVTLSCCETGLGKVTGDGVVGLYRAFFAAGAASVLVTLWKIRDDITRMFMEHFYKEFKATGNVSGSLRSTMVYCIREKKIPPQQWAAFSLIGAAQ